MAFDEARGVTVMFGGNDSSRDGETWEWNGTQWTRRATTGPTPRERMAMTYDPVHQVTLLQGGYDGSANDETWEWDGLHWSLAEVGVPSEIQHHTMSYDLARQEAVLYGGQYYSDYTYFSGDTWTWNGAWWSPAALACDAENEPLAYDAARGRVVLLSSSSGYSSSYSNTWEYNGTGWDLRYIGGPAGRAGFALAYDAWRQVTLLFGGNSDSYSTYRQDTWEWDGYAWYQVASDGPAPRYYSAMAFDQHRGRMVLFGGYGGAYFNDTWEWDDESWALVSGTGPAPRSRHAMAYDVSRQVTVLFGGQLTSSGLSGETWEWDGANWTLRASNGPQARYGAAMTYDADRERIVLFGCVASYTEYGDTWEWDGTSWAQLSIPNSPTGRYGAGMAYDSLRSVIVLYGGTGDSSYGTEDEETWELRTVLPSVGFLGPVDQFISGAQDVTFSVTASGVPPLQYRWWRDEQLLSNGGHISGAHTATLSLSPATYADTGTYVCVVTDTCGSTAGPPGTLTVGLAGDMNCNGVVGFTDINPFVLCLTNPEAYATAYPDCFASNSDINADGMVDFLDINRFVALLTVGA